MPRCGASGRTYCVGTMTAVPGLGNHGSMLGLARVISPRPTLKRRPMSLSVSSLRTFTICRAPTTSSPGARTKRSVWSGRGAGGSAGATVLGGAGAKRGGGRSSEQAPTARARHAVKAMRAGEDFIVPGLWHSGRPSEHPVGIWRPSPTAPGPYVGGLATCDVRKQARERPGRPGLRRLTKSLGWPAHKIAGSDFTRRVRAPRPCGPALSGVQNCCGQFCGRRKAPGPKGRGPGWVEQRAAGDFGPMNLRVEVGDELALEPGDLILQHQLALL